MVREERFFGSAEKKCFFCPLKRDAAVIRRKEALHGPLESRCLVHQRDVLLIHRMVHQREILSGPSEK